VTSLVKKHLFLKLIVLILLVYFISTLVSAQVQINNKREELQKIEQECEEQLVANKELERQILLYQDEEYVQRAAREELGYGTADEKLYIDSSGN
jgi:cell division protein FtsB